MFNSPQICRLGRHTPISKQLRDGILRVGKSTTQKLVKQATDDWFKLLGENHIGELLRLYAQACNHRLAPYLTQIIQDRSLLDPGDTQSPNKQQQPQSTIPVSDTMPATPDVLTTKPESVGTFYNILNLNLGIHFSRQNVHLTRFLTSFLQKEKIRRGARLLLRAQRQTKPLPLLRLPAIQHRPRKPQPLRRRSLRLQVRMKRRSNLQLLWSILLSRSL